MNILLLLAASLSNGDTIPRPCISFHEHKCRTRLIFRPGVHLKIQRSSTCSSGKYIWCEGRRAEETVALLRKQSRAVVECCVVIGSPPELPPAAAARPTVRGVDSHDQHWDPTFLSRWTLHCSVFCPVASCRFLGRGSNWKWSLNICWRASAFTIHPSADSGKSK